MGNILRHFKKGEEEEDHADYLPIYQPQYYSGYEPADAPRLRPRPHQHVLGPRGVTALAPEPVQFEAGGGINSIHFGSLHATLTHERPRVAARDLTAAEPRPAAGPKIGNLQRSNEVLVCANEALAPCRCKTQDIDESSAEGLCDAVRYAEANAMLIQVPVIGTTKKFWRLSDKATRISRKLALILKSHHAVRKYLAAPWRLQVSNVWISSTGIVKLRGVSFTGEHFSIERVRDDYKHLSRVLLELIRISGGDVTKLPADFREFIDLLKRDKLTIQDEFLIVNNSALLPMQNRTEVFLMLCDKINKCLGRTKAGQAKKKRILSKLPYDKVWLDTATANTKINQWVVNVKTPYEGNQYDQLRFNRNVRSHMHDYNDDDGIEEILYCEWPELLMKMVMMLYAEGELQGTGIENKFG